MGEKEAITMYVQYIYLCMYVCVWGCVQAVREHGAGSSAAVAVAVDVVN